MKREERSGSAGPRSAAGGRREVSIEPKTTWRPPTRRAFVAMLGAAAAALALRQKQTVPEPSDPPRSTWSGTTRWIGHC